MASELLELAERVIGPDRAVDAEICHALFPNLKIYHGQHGIDFLAAHNSYADIGKQCPDVPAYTASIDAAMTLLPDDAGFSLKRYWIAATDCPVWSCEISTGGLPNSPRQVFDHYDAATPAIALCAAALRSRHHSGETAK